MVACTPSLLPIRKCFSPFIRMTFVVGCEYFIFMESIFYILYVDSKVSKPMRTINISLKLLFHDILLHILGDIFLEWYMQKYKLYS